jgi:hypothetical protein
MALEELARNYRGAIDRAPAMRPDLSRLRINIGLDRVDSSGEVSPMKAVAAALIAIVVLYTMDSEYNRGRYAQVLSQAVNGVISR